MCWQTISDLLLLLLLFSNLQIIYFYLYYFFQICKSSTFTYITFLNLLIIYFYLYYFLQYHSLASLILAYFLQYHTGRAFSHAQVKEHKFNHWRAINHSHTKGLWEIFWAVRICSTTTLKYTWGSQLWSHCNACSHALKHLHRSWLGRSRVFVTMQSQSMEE